MISNTQEIIDGINKKLENIDKVINSQDKEIKELKRSHRILYEKLYKEKLINDKYKEKCGTLPSTEGSGSRDNE